MPQATDTPARIFAPGERVHVRVASGVFPAVVLEDRGAFATGGKHVFRVRIYPDDPEQLAEFEAHQDQLERVAA